MSEKTFWADLMPLNIYEISTLLHISCMAFMGEMFLFIFSQCFHKFNETIDFVLTLKPSIVWEC